MSCFVLMPFGQQNEYRGGTEESRAVYVDIIQPCVHMAARKLRVKVEINREVERNEPGAVPHSIVNNIAGADLAIVDLTGRNPNVFLELGIRFTMHRSGTILMAQDTSAIPFNIASYRTVIYSTAFNRVDESKRRLTEATEAALTQRLQEQESQQVGKTDSLVYDAFPELEVKLKGILPESVVAREHTSRVVPWDEYWQKIELIADVLRQWSAQGEYDPDVLIGLSNGGLLFADSVLRIAYANAKPLLALWARRKLGDKFLENSVNHEVLNRKVFDHYRRAKAKGQKLQLLVLDDMVGTGTTFSQLLEYLGKHIPDWTENCKLLFVFLYATSAARVAPIREYLLTEDSRFRDRLRNFTYLTDKRELPYRKELAYGETL